MQDKSHFSQNLTTDFLFYTKERLHAETTHII